MRLFVSYAAMLDRVDARKPERKWKCYCDFFPDLGERGADKYLRRASGKGEESLNSSATGTITAAIFLESFSGLNFSAVSLLATSISCLNAAVRPYNLRLSGILGG